MRLYQPMSGELVSGSILCLAAEFAVASELCRRNIYTQLTLGKQKRTDLLLMSSNGGFSRVEVKAKQGREWPNCRGIYGALAFLVFVDYAGRGNTDRPDFFVLTEKDWLRVLNKKSRQFNRENLISESSWTMRTSPYSLMRSISMGNRIREWVF